MPTAPAAPPVPSAPPPPPPPPAPAPAAPGHVLPTAIAATSGPSAINRTPPPKYPAEAAAAEVDGRVILKLLVRTDGTVKDVVVERSEPAGVFDAATVEAARMWTFDPATEDGRPVERWVRVPVDFRSSEDEAVAPAPGGGSGA